MNVTNYKAISALDNSVPVNVRIMEGGVNSTVVKSLEIITHSEDAIVRVYRTDESGNAYGLIKLDLSADSYLMLWEGFVVIPAGHGLWFNADSEGVQAVANVVEL